MIKRFARWIDDRVGGSHFAASALNKIFPDNWSFMLGEVALYSFVVLVVTGVFLTFFFDPSVAETTYEGSYEPLQGVRMSEAYRSTVELSFDVRAGLVMRQAHHWAAIVFIAALFVHMLRVFFTGAFRRPREINWVVGLTLLILAFFNGFTGYSLPDDLLSGTGLRIAYSIALSVPVIGTWLAFLIFGGEFPAEEIIPRLFVTHIMIVPAAIAVLITVHLALIWRQKHTDFPAEGRRQSNVVGPKAWPTYATYSTGLFFAVFAVIMAMGGLIQIGPVWLYGPFRPEQVPSPAQPDWWLGWLEGALRLFPPWETRVLGVEIPNPFYPGVLLPTLVFGALYLWPFLEPRFTRDREPHHLLNQVRDHPVRTAVGVGGLTFFLVLHVAAANDILANWLEASVATITWVFRILVLVFPPLVGYFTYRLMRALQVSRAERLGTLPLQAVLHPAGDGRAAAKEEEAAAAEAAPAEAEEAEERERPEPAVAGRGWLTLYQDAAGLWRWRYADDDLELQSNKSFPDAEAAAASATQAYPGTPIAGAED